MTTVPPAQIKTAAEFAAKVKELGIKDQVELTKVLGENQELKGAHDALPPEELAKVNEAAASVFAAQQALAGAAPGVVPGAAPQAAPQAAPAAPPAAPKKPTTPPPADEGFSWKKWGAAILGGIGVLITAGSVFFGEEEGKGKNILTAIGGLLLGGSVLSYFPSLGWLFGGGDEAPKPPVPATAVAKK